MQSKIPREVFSSLNFLRPLSSGDATNQDRLLPKWLSESTVARPSVPFSLVRPRQQAFRDLSPSLRHLARTAFELPAAGDAAVAILRIAEDPSLTPEMSGRCGLQAGLILLDAGDQRRGWNVIQRSMARMTSAPESASSSASPSLFASDWIALAAGAVAACDDAAAGVWLRRAVHSIRSVLVHSVAFSPATRSLTLVEHMNLMGDILALRSVLFLRRRQMQTALSCICEAIQFFERGADDEAMAGALLWRAFLYARSADQEEAALDCSAARTVLMNLPADRCTFHTSVICNLLNGNYEGSLNAQLTPACTDDIECSGKFVEPLFQRSAGRSRWN
ncbi:MAG: hypothetical protein KDA91_17530 [Planctomycetaceae bacterium]|nr:hypothetical protein [Planctomycetaceae bacterium]